MKRVTLFAALLSSLAVFTACNRNANKTPLDSGEPLVEVRWGNRAARQNPQQQTANPAKDNRRYNDNIGNRPSRQTINRPYDDSPAQRYQSDNTAPYARQTHSSSSSTTAADLALALPAPRRDLPEQRLTRKAYTASFNHQTLMPNWVAWKLIRDHTYGSHQRSSVKFSEDYDVDASYRVNTFDYNRSGYDRGHMCPAGDNKWDSQTMAQCFLMTNICPQGHNLNSGDWNDLEIKCRDWARHYGEIYIVCGPILYDNAHRRIGQRHKVTVPDAFFKVVLCMKGTPKAIGFVYRNEDGHRPMHEYACSVDEVERITHFDFFPALPDNIEKTVEAHANFGAW
ncbi:MAG: DNA/RNA non-specific endonuclease [Prevotella sp.]|nr:DNA/RNA non-specific endonuclease [Prevotella sp.]